jgi:hypothetical protein
MIVAVYARLFNRRALLCAGRRHVGFRRVRVGDVGGDCHLRRREPGDRLKHR